MPNDAYAIQFTRRARKDLDKLDSVALNRIAPAIDALILDPRPPGCLKVKNTQNMWRVRVGDWRIGYEIEDAKQEVTIVRIAHRSEFYS